MNYKIIKHGISNVRNKIAESLFLKFNIDYTRPVQIYGLVNHKCNLKCGMCDHWRIKNPDELPASEWIKGLKSLKSFVGTFHINLSGGEPLLKKDFFDIIEFCYNENISVGYTTNGVLLNDKNIKKSLELNVFNINISLDSMDENINDRIRGVPKLSKKIKENIRNLAYRIKENGKGPKVIIKPTVCNKNLNGLDKIVEFVKELNFTGINFQPIAKWSKEAEKMFIVDKNELVHMIDTLIKMKKNGYPIINSEESIKQWVEHFDEKIPERSSACVVPLRNLLIDANGDFSLCPFIDSSKIGNIQNDDIKEMWYSPKSRELKNNLIKCKRLCTAVCVVKRSWKDYFNLFSQFMKD